MNLLVCLALISGSLSLRQLDGRIQDSQLELKSTQRQLHEIKQRIFALQDREASSLARLEAYREQVSVTRRYISQLDNQVEARTEEIVTTTRRIDEAEARVRARKEDLARRLVTIYKYGQLLPLETFLSSKSVTKLHRRMFYLRWIARADRRMAAELDALKQQLAAERIRLVGARAELERLRQERVTEERTLEASRAAEAELVRKVRSEREAQERLERELNQAMQRLQELLNSLEQQRRLQAELATNHYFEVNKGRLPWPIRGSIIAGFGSQVHPKYKTKTNNRGIDIETAAGQPVRAIWDGTVAYADQFMGYGRMVILDHEGGFYTLYGNLDEITATVGEKVMTAQALGKSKEYVHFEVRKQGQPVDPQEWLQP